MAEAQDRRLDSWKEIAAYLGRDVTTVRRWEKLEGLPVRRHHHAKLGSVYAQAGELDAWRAERASRGGAGVASTAPVEPAVPAAPLAARSLGMWPVAVVALALAVGLTWRLLRTHTPAESGPVGARVRSLAVLPLANFSGDPAQDYLADGMTEALIARLAVIRGLRVVSRTSTLRFKGSRKPMSEIAGLLNVDALVEGSVLRSGDRIRVNVQLIRGATDEHLGSTTLDREFRDVLTLQSEVAQTIARSVQAALTDGESRRLVATRPVSPDAYDSYLKGEFALHRSGRSELVKAIGFFEHAIELDPAFAPAYAGLAAAQSTEGTILMGGVPADARAKALASLDRALKLDPELVEARLLRAGALEWEWRWAEAETEYRRALELNPNGSRAHAGFARWLLYQGRTEEALAFSDRARALDPMALTGTDRGDILFFSRRYDDAVKEARRVISVEPENVWARFGLAIALIASAKLDEAIESLERLTSGKDQGPAELGLLARAYALAGRRHDALRVLDELHRRRQQGYVPSAAFLNAYLGLGDKERAFDWLERAVEERSNIVKLLKVHPLFDPLRGDPRFASYLRRANLQ